MNVFKRLFAPVVTVQTVNAIAQAAGTSFSKLLEKALLAGEIDAAKAAELVTRAAVDESQATQDLETAIAAANAKFAADMAGVDETKLAASQTKARADEVLTAVNEAKRTIGK